MEWGDTWMSNLHGKATYLHTVSTWIQPHSWIQPHPLKTPIKFFHNDQVFVKTVVLGPENGSNSKHDA